MQWIDRGIVPGPALKVAGRRLFTETEVTEIDRVVRQRQVSRKAESSEAVIGSD
jgi:hypothetical protein